MANFGVYIQITNQTGQPLGFVASDSGGCSPCTAPPTIPSDGRSYTVHFGDPCFSEGAEGTVYYLTLIDGKMRKYAWYGSCPVTGSNEAEGPGIQSWTGPHGHPTYITVLIDKNTPGWTPFPPDKIAETKLSKAAAAGKKPSDPTKLVKWKGKK
jgi:hypothetical protein